MYMEIAQTVAKRSTCSRLNVGAIIVADGNIVSMGYNGAATGEPHCSNETCDFTKPCQRATHAEDNALSRCKSSCTAMDVYVTHSPCRNCASMIAVNAHINRVFFGVRYRDDAPIKHLLKFMEVFQVLPNGQLIECRNGEIIGPCTRPEVFAMSTAPII